MFFNTWMPRLLLPQAICFPIHLISLTLLLLLVCVLRFALEIIISTNIVWGAKRWVGSKMCFGSCSIWLCLRKSNLHAMYRSDWSFIHTLHTQTFVCTTSLKSHCYAMHVCSVCGWVMMGNTWSFLTLNFNLFSLRVHFTSLTVELLKLSRWEKLSISRSTSLNARSTFRNAKNDAIVLFNTSILLSRMPTRSILWQHLKCEWKSLKNV